MSKRKDSLVYALEQGRSFTWVEPDGGDLASMRGIIKHEQSLTMSPVVGLAEIKVGDIVLVKWHNGYIVHLVKEIQSDQFLIANSMGKINGWASGNDILGRVTEIVEPQPRPSVPTMLEQLEIAFRELIESEQPGQSERHRLISILDDLCWYADRIGASRWEKQPKLNLWSFEQRLWHLTKQAKSAVFSGATQSILYFIDQGKSYVGLAAETHTLFESKDAGE